jgi:hypothetical protein
VAREWGKIHKEEVQNVNYSQNMNRMIKENEMDRVYSMNGRK